MSSIANSLTPARTGSIVLYTCAAFLALGVAPGQAADPEAKMKLFKIVSQRDETVIGLKTEELRNFGKSGDLENLAQQFSTAGQMVVWQYATKKGTDGQLQQAPAQRIAVFASGISRIEPYTTPLMIVAPSE